MSAFHPLQLTNECLVTSRVVRCMPRFTRKTQCIQLARIFNRLADEAQGDQVRAARCRDLAREYEVEAKQRKDCSPRASLRAFLDRLPRRPPSRAALRLYADRCLGWRDAGNARSCSLMFSSSSSSIVAIPLHAEVTEYTTVELVQSCALVKTLRNGWSTTDIRRLPACSANPRRRSLAGGQLRRSCISIAASNRPSDERCGSRRCVRRNVSFRPIPAISSSRLDRYQCAD